MHDKGGEGEDVIRRKRSTDEADVMSLHETIVDAAPPQSVASKTMSPNGKANGEAVAQDYFQVGTEKISQITATTLAWLITLAVSYFAGPMTLILYGVVLIIPCTALVQLVPEMFCLSFNGIRLTSNRSDMSYTLFFWGYWMILNYVFFLAEFHTPFFAWYVVPLSLLYFALSTFVRPHHSNVVGVAFLLAMVLPMEGVGVFREAYWVTVIRVVVYFVGFFLTELITKVSGLAIVAYLGWVLLAWAYLLPLIVAQLVWLWYTERRFSPSEVIHDGNGGMAYGRMPVAAAHHQQPQGAPYSNTLSSFPTRPCTGPQATTAHPTASKASSSPIATTSKKTMGEAANKKALPTTKKKTAKTAGSPMRRGDVPSAREDRGGGDVAIPMAEYDDDYEDYYRYNPYEDDRHRAKR